MKKPQTRKIETSGNNEQLVIRDKRGGRVPDKQDYRQTGENRELKTKSPV